MITSLGRVEVRDAAFGVDHRQRRASRVRASIDVRSQRARVPAAARRQSAPRPSFGLTPAVERGPVLGEEFGEVRTHRVAEDDRVGHLHHRRLEVHGEEHALSCASATCSARNRSSAARRITAASITSPARTGTLIRATVAPSAATCSIRDDAVAGHRDRLLGGAEVALAHRRDVRARACDQAPIGCGCARAYAFTDADARRSELPCRSTGFTALP